VDDTGYWKDDSDIPPWGRRLAQRIKRLEDEVADLRRKAEEETNGQG
jgi:hypothetical protein